MRHPACDFPLQDVHEVSRLIDARLENAKPFSLVRVGDGEGLLLSISDQSPRMDFEYLARHLGPSGRDPDFVLHLKDRLTESVMQADVIGVRDDTVDVEFDAADLGLGSAVFLDKFRQRFRLREAEKSLDYHGSRRIALTHATLGNMDFGTGRHFCSAWFHYDYHTSGAVFRALSEQKRIGLISCRSRLPRMLEDLFGVSVAFYQIPDMFEQLPAAQTVTGYAERFEQILQLRLVDRPGMLFLVGGGLYGKLFCSLVKSQGGVALDLGSLLDAWLGIPSRPTVLKSKFIMGPGAVVVPPALLLTSENIDRLIRVPDSDGSPDGC